MLYDRSRYFSKISEAKETAAMMKQTADRDQLGDFAPEFPG
jgi:hypothetical protein